MPRPKNAPAARSSAPPPAPIEVIDPRWLLKALGVVMVAALVCGYLTLCLLFYQGQWQLVLHPVRSDAALSSLPGGEAVRFDAAESGLPRLSGVWLAAPAMTRYPGLTVLYLRGGDGSLAGSAVDAANLARLHELGLGAFAFDYRGYGESEGTHPTEARMREDAAAGLRYLTEVRRISAGQIVVYGTGVGASLAAGLAAGNGGLAGVVLDSPGVAPLQKVMADPRTREMPVRMLLHERFDLDALAGLKMPKLLISYPAAGEPVRGEFREAADPKTTLELPPGNATALLGAMGRFLDEFVKK